MHRFIKEPIRTGLSWEELWKASDNGLIYCWERGREIALSNPDLAQSCRDGELPVLAWKGGVGKEIKAKKYGSLFYLATWQGLRNEDLNIDTIKELSIICIKTKVEVIFSSHLLEYEISNLSDIA